MSFLIGLTGEYASVLNGYRQGSVPNREEQGFFRKYFGGVGQITPFGGGTDIDEQ